MLVVLLACGCLHELELERCIHKDKDIIGYSPQEFKRNDGTKHVAM